MIMEMKHVRQIDGEGYRRWFSDDYFDLYTWHSETYDIVGFQLCYGYPEKNKALTWRNGQGFSHDNVDEGESNAMENKTPVLTSDGLFPKETIAEMFLKLSVNIDQRVADFVHNKLLDYPG